MSTANRPRGSQANQVWTANFWALFGAMLLWLSQQAGAADFDYGLRPRNVAPDTWVMVGKTEDFSLLNGGNIVNTGFIVTAAGVVVIDSGPSLRYGRQMRAAIARITDKPVIRVYNTHHHPDHFLGNQAYPGLPVLALSETKDGEENQGGAFNDNMYRMNGDWMRDTEPAPANTPAQAGRENLGGHELEVLALKGHTAADLVVFDRSTGVLFTGDLCFFNRAPTTPHADLPNWHVSLDALEKLPYKVLVPGHGEPTQDGAPIRQTRDWLRWLESALRAGVAEGADMAEMLGRPLPERFQAMPLARREYQRSVSHLFPRLEREALGGRP